jgi:hypothetical protein
MKKFVLLSILGIGLLFFGESCSPYYYDHGYARAYPPPVRYYAPPPPRYYATPPPVYRYRRHYRHRNW